MTCACIPDGYKLGATFETMGLNAGVRINLLLEIEFLLYTEFNDFVIEATMTPATLEIVLVEKFGKEN